MKAITVRQPWAWAICHAGKRVENREWNKSPGMIAQARRLVGQTIAIHAAQGGTQSGCAAAMAGMLDRVRMKTDLTPARQSLPVLPYRQDMPRGAIVATALLADVYDGGYLGHRRHDFGRCSLCGQENPTQRELLRGAPFGGGQCPKRDPWAIDGQTWLILADVAVLPRPVPAKGGQGWWTLPDGAPCGERVTS